MDFFQQVFIQRALIAGGLLALVSGILGSLVILRRMAFFSDAIAHAGLTGIALGLLIGISPTLGAVGFSLAVGLMVIWLSQQKYLHVDSVIGVLFSGSVALGILILSQISGYKLNLVNYLFGDILAISGADLGLTIIFTIIVSLVTIFGFRQLLFTSFSQDLAKVSGLNVKLWNYLLAVLLALTIALAIKVVGVILVSALIVIPSTSSKLISGSVREMIAWAIGFGVISVFIGIAAAYRFDLPSGPAIVMVEIFIFILAWLFRND